MIYASISAQLRRRECSSDTQEMATAARITPSQNHIYPRTRPKRHTAPTDLLEPLLGFPGPPDPPRRARRTRIDQLCCARGGPGVQGSPGEAPGGRQVECVFFGLFWDRMCFVMVLSAPLLPFLACHYCTLVCVVALIYSHISQIALGT